MTDPVLHVGDCLSVLAGRPVTPSSSSDPGHDPLGIAHTMLSSRVAAAAWLPWRVAKDGRLVSIVTAEEPGTVVMDVLPTAGAGGPARPWVEPWWVDVAMRIAHETVRRHNDELARGASSRPATPGGGSGRRDVPPGARSATDTGGS